MFRIYIKLIWRYYKQNGLYALYFRIKNKVKNIADISLLNKWVLREKGDIKPENILCNIDSPLENKKEINDLLVVDGWAYSRYGIESIEACIKGKEKINISMGIPRPDVAKELSAKGCYGISGTVSIGGIEEGEQCLLITITDNNGNRRTIARKFRVTLGSNIYKKYFYSHMLTGVELNELENKIKIAEWDPIIEIWIDATECASISTTVNSLCMQEYNRWVCYMLVSNETRTTVQKTLEYLLNEEEKNKFITTTKIANNANSENCSNVYIGFLKPNEHLNPGCLIQLVWHAYQNKGANLIYSDSDYIDVDGEHFSPNFKYNFSMDYLLSKNYIRNFYLTKKNNINLNKVELYRDTYRCSWRYRLLIDIAQGNNENITHINKVLWSESKLDNNYHIKEETEVVNEYLREQCLPEKVIHTNQGRTRRIKWAITNAPLVSIIIPTTGKKELIVTAIESIKKYSSYKNYELLIIDNGRGSNRDGIDYVKNEGIKVIEIDEEFNWARINNIGASHARGEMLLFLNDDIQILDNNWLEELVSQAGRPEVGSVGAMLLYPDGTIQHAGVFLVDHGGGARHYLTGLDPNEEIYQNLHEVVREVSANTGACLMIRRDVFTKVGGFDEDLKLVGNDIDMCLRIKSYGYKNIWTPYCRFLHFESMSRKEAVIKLDEEKMWKKWAKMFEAGDYFYNSNLSQDKTDCSINFRNYRKRREELKAKNGEKGINLIGYIRAEMGLGEGARSEAKAMDSAGIPYCIIDYEELNPARKNDNSFVHRIVENPVYGINLLHVNADCTQFAYKKLKRLFDKRYTIGYWAWELSEFPDEWLGSLDYVDEVWVPSTFVQNAINRKTRKPVICIPHSISKYAMKYYGREYFGLPESKYLFLMVYDENSIQQRKNPEGCIDAFKKSFGGRDNEVGLVIKVNNPSRNDLSELNKLVNLHPNIYVIDKIYNRHEMDSLFSVCNCYVSLHRSEGFGLTIAEAMYLGKPVIATNWSGNVDYMGDSNSACVDYTLVELERDYGPYIKGNIWAEPDIDHASWWMKKIYVDRELSQKMGKRARNTIREKLSPGAVGGLISSRLNMIDA